MRGQVVPVFDLNRFYGLNHETKEGRQKRIRKNRNKKDTYYLFIDLDSESFAVAISGFPQKLVMSGDKCMERKPDLPNELYKNVDQVYFDESLWCCWNIQAFQKRVTEMFNSV